MTTPFLQQLDPRGERLRDFGLLGAERLFITGGEYDSASDAFEKTVEAVSRDVSAYVRERGGSMEDAMEAWRIVWSHFEQRFEEIVIGTNQVGQA